MQKCAVNSGSSVSRHEHIHINMGLNVPDPKTISFLDFLIFVVKFFPVTSYDS